MIPLAHPDPAHVEKRTQRTLMVVLIDQRGRAVWNSLEPLDGGRQTVITDHVPLESRERVTQMLSRCIISGEIVEYTTQGDIPPINPDGSSQGMVNWHVMLFPTSGHFPGIAAVAVCRILSTNDREITTDDKDLLQMLCDDCTLKETADRMFLSASAIDTRIKNLKHKLGVKNIGGLVAAALLQSVI